MGNVFDFEDKKILFETIKKILYGIEFDELPPARILRFIEDEYVIVLEFKEHFRYLVPQVYGWEFMDRYMYGGVPFPHGPNEREENNSRVEERLSLRPVNKGDNYFELCHHINGSNNPEYKKSLKYAASVCESLFYSFVFLLEEIKAEEEYMDEKGKQGAIFEEIYSQLSKYLGDNLEFKIYSGLLSGEFVDSLINNKLVKCEDTLSGEDSSLTNFWEEYCVQVQKEHSVFWQTYLQQLYLWIREEFEKLPKWQRNAIWLELKDKDITEYFDREFDPNESKDENAPFCEDDAKNVDVENKKYYDLNEVIDLITDEITSKAADFTNEAIESYLYGNC